MTGLADRVFTIRCMLCAGCTLCCVATAAHFTPQELDAGLLLHLLEEVDHLNCCGEICTAHEPQRRARPTRAWPLEPRRHMQHATPRAIRAIYASDNRRWQRCKMQPAPRNAQRAAWQRAAWQRAAWQLEKCAIQLTTDDVQRATDRTQRDDMPSARCKLQPTWSRFLFVSSSVSPSGATSRSWNV